jgi:5,10-methenyltetrahydrofolate synthetase
MDTQFDVKAWRRGERERLLALRMAHSAQERAVRAERITAALDRLLVDRPAATVSFYWPFRGEFDLRSWIASRLASGARAALPVVVEKRQPMIFRRWSPGCRMERGIWNIPVPSDGPELIPDVVIAPLVGFDPDKFRLGYGGGYFDRTLASLPAKPLVVGIGLASTRLETIHPQDWDIPMDAIITEESPFGEDALAQARRGMAC